jgi:hypothetical protein
MNTKNFVSKIKYDNYKNDGQGIYFITNVF